MDGVEEVYFYDTLEEAEEAREIMIAERACDMAFYFKQMANGHYKMTVEVGEVRG